MNGRAGVAHARARILVVAAFIMMTGAGVLGVLSLAPHSSDSLNSKLKIADSLPTAPTGLNATTVSSTEIDINWTLPSGTLTEGSYYEFADSGCSGQPVGYDTGGPYVNAVAVSGLSPGTSFSFRVASWNSSGEGPVSACATNTTLTALIATAVSSTAIDLNWALPSVALTDGSYYEFAGSTCSGSIMGFDTGGPYVDSITVPDLAPGATYSFEVASWTNDGELPVGNCATATTPSALTVTAVSSTAVDLSWTLPSGTLTDGSYYEFVGSTCSGLPIGFDTGGPYVDGVTVSGLTPGTTYSFEVASWTGDVELPVGDCETATTPGALTATGVSSTAITLSWSLPLGTLTDGSYYEFAGPGCLGSAIGFDTGGPYVNGVTVTGLYPGTTYSFEVASWTSGGELPVGDCETAITPGSLSAAGVSSTAIALSWALPPGTLTDGSYYVFAGSACSGSPDGYDTGGPYVDSVTVGGLAPGTTYSFEVASWTGSGELPVGNCAIATTPGPLAATAVSGRSINLTWVLPSGALTDGSYYVFAGSTCSGSPKGYDTGGPYVNSVTVSGLTPDTTYSFEVASWTSVGELPVGNCATATTPPIVETQIIVNPTQGPVGAVSTASPIGLPALVGKEG